MRITVVYCIFHEVTGAIFFRGSGFILYHIPCLLQQLSQKESEIIPSPVYYSALQRQKTFRV